MESDLERRIEHLEERLDELERHWTAEREQDRKRRRRDSWVRTCILIAAVIVYVMYIQGVSSIV